MNPETSTTRSQQTGALLVIASGLSFSALPILIKQVYLIDSGLNPLNVILYRFIFAVPLIWTLALANPVPAAARARLPRLRLLAVGMIFAPNAWIAFSALELIPASTYSLVFYSYPAIIVFFSVLFLGEGLPRRGWLALLVTLSGVTLTVPNIERGLSGSDPLGILLTFGNIASYSFYFLLYSRLLRGQSALLHASAWNMTGALLALIVMVALQGFILPASPASWLILAAMGAVGTVIPLTTLFAGVKRIGAARAAILSAVEPISTLILALLLLGERLQPLQWLGGALILTGVVLLQHAPTPRPAPTHQSEPI